MSMRVHCVGLSMYLDQFRLCLHESASETQSRCDMIPAVKRAEPEAARAQAEAQPPRSRTALAAHASIDEDRRRCRRSTDELCGACEPCRVRMTCPVVWPRGTPAAKRKRLGSTYAPCEARLMRMGYRRSELETVYDLLCCDSHPDFPEYLPHDCRQLYHSW